MFRQIHFTHWVKGFIINLFILMPVISQGAIPSKITTLRVFSTNYSTRIIFNLSTAANFHVFTLKNPNRLVLDFENTKLGLNLNQSHLLPPLKSIRQGHPDAKTLRIVIDMDAPFTFKQLKQDNSRQIVFDVNTKKSIFFANAVKKILTVPLAQKEKLPAIENKIQEKISRPFIVVIDAGHGGKDTGAIGVYKTREKDIVLSIATQLADLVNSEPNMRAVLTRKGDYFVPLANRLVLARKGEADLFIAIHADSYFNTRANGASVFALSSHGATTVAAKWLSDSDNHSELGGVELNRLNDKSYLLRSVLIDLAQTATIRDSLRLGNSILDTLEKITKLHSPRVEQAPFMVLKSPDIPSVLVETGFVSNPREELRLRDKNYQRQITLALFNGIKMYQKKYAPQ